MYIHYKTRKINENIERINALTFEEPKSPEAFSKHGERMYDVIDVITLFENYHSLINDILKRKLLSSKLSPKAREELKEVRKITNKWKHVRNKIGGHLELGTIREFCEKYNYKGVFISDNLEADFKGVLLLMMVESAINSTNKKSHLFSKELQLTQSNDLRLFITKFMADWAKCLFLFKTILEFLYGLGKLEKLKTLSIEEIGIIKF